MPCETVILDGGIRAIVCGGRRRQHRCACGARAPRQCDWKIEGGTCSRYICVACSTKPEPGKDLCREHATAWDAWKAQRTARPSAPIGVGASGQVSRDFR
jgi:hypothetical protein